MTKLNCDMGESFGIYRAGNDEEIMPLIIGWGLSWEAQQFILGLLIIPMVALYARSPHIRSQI